MRTAVASRAKALRLSPALNTASRLPVAASKAASSTSAAILTAFPRPSPMFRPECPPSRPAGERRNAQVQHVLGLMQHVLGLTPHPARIPSLEESC